MPAAIEWKLQRAHAAGLPDSRATSRKMQWPYGSASANPKRTPANEIVCRG